MTTAFAQLFWGFLFDLIDFRINRFDLMPDVIGFLLIMLGCNTLRRYNLRFSVSFAIAIPLMIFSLFDLVHVRGVQLSIDASGGPVGAAIGISVLLAIFVFALDLVMTYNVCAGSGRWPMSEAFTSSLRRPVHAGSS
jgi:hypothetical protein